MSHSNLLTQFETQFKQQGKAILDLACGVGRNGLYLHNKGLPVHFVEQNKDALDELQSEHRIPATHCFNINLENGKPFLIENSYQAIVVFRYLHRPLMQQIKAAVEPGGLVIYETFTTDNRQFGRPNRDAFLLKKNELKETFQGWHCLHYFEGIKHNPDRAIAQIVCQKPIS